MGTAGAQLKNNALTLAVGTMSIVLVTAAVYFLGSIRSALVIIVASVFLAYAIAPLITFFKQRSPLPVAVLLAYLTLVVIVGLFFFVVVPPIVEQSRQLIVAFPTIVEKTLTSIEASGVFARLPASINTFIDQVPAKLTQLASVYGPRIAQQGLGVALSVVSIAVSIILVPILSAYLIFDAADLQGAFLGLFPPSLRPRACAVLADINAVLGGYIRGQLLDGLIVGALIFGMLSINHVPFAFLIAVAAGVLNLVPYLGAVVGFVPSVLLALTYNGWQSALIVAGLFAVIQQVDGNFIVPRIMQANVSLSPVVLVVSIIVFSDLFGLFGTFIAVPLAAVLRVLKIHFAPAPDAAAMVSIAAAARPLRRLD
jgi:predicted PurR-regulated permease PerM